MLNQADASGTRGGEEALFSYPAFGSRRIGYQLGLLVGAPPRSAEQFVCFTNLGTASAWIDQFC
jgi:hypothetical protein